MRSSGVPRELGTPLTVFVLFQACLLAVAAGQSPRLIDVYDGFESSRLSASWNTERSLPGAVEIQSEIVRSGKSAARITLHPGDQLDDEKGTILERAELMEARELVSHENTDYAYSFSMFLPRDFPIVPARLVIAQWKQYCPSGRCDPDNPVLALRYQGGEFRVTLRAGAKTQTLFRTADEIRGQWLDFVFLIRFSREGKGRIRATLNGRQIVDYTGVTAYSEMFGYPPAGRFYFKMGLYRDRTKETMKIYVDEYRKKELPKDNS
jgi:hypothetical protein